MVTCFISCSFITELFSSDEDDADVDISYIPEPDLTRTLPIGMNISGLKYYSKNLIFNDVMTTASVFRDYNWSIDLDGLIVDDNGYPTYIPQTLDGSETKIRFLVNNYYTGRYRIFYDGDGTLSGNVSSDSNGYYIDLNGAGTNKWIDIEYSNASDPITNMHIISDEYGIYDNNAFNIAKSDGSYETFDSRFLTGLEDFSCLRFMDWISTNGSTQVYWDDRILTSHYSQSTASGISFDYAIELCNELQVDAWVCIPHKASDNYIEELATLWKDGLDENLTIYLEYSNELWNWMFSQTSWVSDNATDAVDDYITGDLAELEDYPEKDAYMMARTFRIWDEVFGANSDRIVRVATGQQSWPGNTGRIMRHLFEDDGIGCDALAVTGYFGFSSDSHTEWLEYGDDLSMKRIYRDTYDYLIENTADNTRESAAYANTYDVDYLVYEGGQHMQPYNQSEWDYNQQLYDFQLTDFMYNLYMFNFEVHVEDDVDCKLFVAFNSVSERETKYGSWGHLENMDQIGSDYSNAPKYQVLLDANY